MKQLLILLLLLVGTYVGATALDALVPSLTMSTSLRGRISLAVFFCFTGIGHFAMPEEMAQMLPDFVPGRVGIIYLSGVLEIAAAIALLVPDLRVVASVALIIFLVGILPANIYAAVAEIDFGGHRLGVKYLLARVPFQFFVIAWTYHFGLRLAPS